MGKANWVIDLTNWPEPLRTLALIGAIVGMLVAVFGGMFVALAVAVIAVFYASLSVTGAVQAWFGLSDASAEMLAVGVFLVFATTLYYAARLAWQLLQHRRQRLKEVRAIPGGRSARR
jgi:hypothetical protein